MKLALQTIIGACALALLWPGAAEAAKKRKDVMAEIAPWANDPDRIKLEVVERLVFEKKQYASALPIIAAIRKEGINDPILDLVQGVAMREEGMLDEAESLLVDARKRLPSDPRVHEALCVLYADQQSMDQAIAACEKATKVDRERSSAWNNLGYLYMVSDRPLEAIEAMSEAVELDGAEPRYRNNLAMSHVSAGKPAKGLEIFRTTNSEADAQYNMGVAIERFSNPEDSLAWYRRALEADEKHQLASQAIERITKSADPEENQE